MRLALTCLLFVAALGCSATEATGTCAGPKALSVGVTASGVARTDECQGPNGESGHLYTFTLAAQTNIEFTMASSGFDGNLMVFPGKPTTGSATPVFDVEGSGTIGARAFLPAGEYYVVVSTAGSKGGSYTLNSLPSAALSDCSLPGWTRPGVSISGTITATDCVGLSTVRMDVYEMNLTAGQSITVNATLGKNGGVSLRTGAATSADLVTKNLPTGGPTSFTFTAPSAGAYRVHLLSEQFPSGPVSYSVSIQ